MILNCAIIDDEPLAAELLASYADKTPSLNLIGCYNSAVSAIKDIREKSIDILFLDIQMPELSGLEFAKLIPKQTKIIFTTAFDQYAIEGYKVNALDYLLKPISYENFLMSVKRAEAWFENSYKQDTFKRDKFIYVKSEYKHVQVPLDDVTYIEGLKDYVKFYFADDTKPVMSLMSMKNLEEFLPRPDFMRIHRSFIVHMSKAKLIDRMRIVFGDIYLPVSDSYKDDVANYINEHTIG